MKRYVGLALALLCGSACSRNDALAAEPSRPVVLTGSSTIAPVVAEMAKKFESLNPGARIDVQTGGSSRGVSDARSGIAAIGMVSRSLSATEKDLSVYPIAKDGVCLIVNRANPISALNDDQIVGIYTGKIRNWSVVGGSNAPITVVNKAEGRSTLELFLHYFKLKNADIEADVVIGDNEQGIKTVAGNPNAIGYVSIGTAEYDVNRGVKIKLLPMNGVQPSLETVSAGTFPLSRDLNLVIKGKPTGVAGKFLDFATSDQTHDIIRSQSFVPIAHR